MNPIKKLASQTAIYGLGHVLGKLLFIFFLPVYTSIFETNEYGVLTLLFSYVAFANIIFTYGFETAFFRALNKAEDERTVFNTSNLSLIGSSIVFGSIIILFNQPIAEYFNISDKPQLINWFVYIIFFDTICTIPLAYLRHQGKADSFAKIKLINIFVQIGFNLFFLMPVLVPGKVPHFVEYMGYEYDPSINIGYVILANLIGSLSSVLILTPSFLKIRFQFDTSLWKDMLKFSYPLVMIGLAAMTNEMIDRILLKELLDGTSKENDTAIGIYGGCYKIAMFIAIANTAFRQAAEPFFFSHSKSGNAKETYATILRYYAVFCSLLFLGIMLFIEPIKNFMLHENYYEGIVIVPILLMANIFAGIYYNLSIWYKLASKTIYGAYISVTGAIITLALNFLLIPYLGYIGSAWATLICYFSMVVLSYFWGQKHYPIKYNLRKIGFYLLVSLSFYFISTIYTDKDWLHYVFNSSLLITFILMVLYIEKPQKYLS